MFIIQDEPDCTNASNLYIAIFKEQLYPSLSLTESLMTRNPGSFWRLLYVRNLRKQTEYTVRIEGYLFEYYTLEKLSFRVIRSTTFS